jgi:hypothetical protein
MSNVSNRNGAGESFGEELAIVRVEDDQRNPRGTHRR